MSGESAIRSRILKGALGVYESPTVGERPMASRDLLADQMLEAIASRKDWIVAKGFAMVWHSMRGRNRLNAL